MIEYSFELGYYQVHFESRFGKSTLFFSLLDNHVYKKSFQSNNEEQLTTSDWNQTLFQNQTTIIPFHIQNEQTIFLKKFVLKENSTVREFFDKYHQLANTCISNLDYHIIYKMMKDNCIPTDYLERYKTYKYTQLTDTNFVGYGFNKLKDGIYIIEYN